MAGVSRRKGVFAFAKQSAVGTAVSNTATKYALPQVSGGMKPTRDRGEMALTSSSQGRRGWYVQRARGEGTITILGHPDEIGLPILAAMGSEAFGGGAGPLYDHVFTMNDQLPLPMTVWTLVGDDWWRFSDTFVQRLSIKGASGENVMIELGLLSFGARRLGTTAPTYTLVDEDPRFKYIDSVVKMEANSATPTVMTNAENAELVIDRMLELRYGSSLTPTQQIAGRNVDFSAGIVYDDAGNQGWDFLAGAQLGAVALTGDVSQNLIKGSFEVAFGRHPSSDGSRLIIASNGAAWEYGVERPDADPAGGPLEMDMAGPVIPPPGATEVTVTLTNTVSAAY